MSSRLTLDFKSAHKFVNDQRRMGSDIRWDGYDIVIWKPTHYGFTNKRGAFRNGRWGMETRVVVGNDGSWKVPFKSVKSSR